MASLQQHKDDCVNFIGTDFESVHRWMDECFSKFGPYHRRERHHLEGVDWALGLFGADGRRAALLHVLRDCRHIPHKRDYCDGTVDALGLKKQWSTAAFVKYSDADFEELVKEQLKPSALVLWAFLDWNDTKSLLTAVTTYTEEQVDSLKQSWEKSYNQMKTQEPSAFDQEAFREVNSDPECPDEAREYMLEVLQQAVPEEKRSNAYVGSISLDVLTNPFVYLDYELLEDLKPELAGSTSLELAKFALPKTVQMPITAVGDAAQRSVTLVSRQKTMTVGQVRLRATPQGTEVSYVVSANPAGIVVSDMGGRYLLTNGIHRAYLMAQLGITRIPCIIIREGHSIAPFMNSPYPMFTPELLSRPRQPLLSDFLRPEFCLQAPVRRSQRLIRITAEEINIPAE